MDVNADYPFYKAGIVCAQNKQNKGSQVRRTKIRKNFSPIGSWICPHTAKKDQKRSTKNPIIYFSYAKVTKVQSVLKTDQRAYVSAHAFFSAHEAKKHWIFALDIGFLVDLFWSFFFAVCKFRYLLDYPF